MILGLPIYLCSLARRLETDNQPAFGRSIEIFQGKGLGGFTRINHMFYTRGPSGQYDAWERDGADGWDPRLYCQA